MKSLFWPGLTVLLATLVGCATFELPRPMRGAEVTAADRAPEVKTYDAKIPGVGQPHIIARTFVGQPPLVPHEVDKYLPISQDDNACLECHITDELRGQKIPKAGVSHFSPTRKRADGSPDIDMARFQCNNCHVPQVDARPLVDSLFIGVTK